jgi:RNA polymerase sigma-70 factor (ECF subfamily)
MQGKSDIEYIEQVMAGNAGSFSHVVARHKDHAFNLAYRICGNREEAEEITQDSFVKAYRALGEFRMKSSFSTWLYRIVYNTAISYIRGRKKGALSLEDFPADAVDFLADCETEIEAEREYRNSLLNFALQKLSEDERALISLYYYEELNLDEMEAVTGIDKSNIKVKLFRSRQKMYAIIMKEENKKTVYNE